MSGLKKAFGSIMVGIASSSEPGGAARPQRDPGRQKEAFRGDAGMGCALPPADGAAAAPKGQRDAEQESTTVSPDPRSDNAPSVGDGHTAQRTLGSVVSGRGAGPGAATLRAGDRSLDATDNPRANQGGDAARAGVGSGDPPPIVEGQPHAFGHQCLVESRGVSPCREITSPRGRDPWPGDAPLIGCGAMGALKNEIRTPWRAGYGSTWENKAQRPLTPGAAAVPSSVRHGDGSQEAGFGETRRRRLRLSTRSPCWCPSRIPESLRRSRSNLRWLEELSLPEPNQAATTVAGTASKTRQ